MMHYIERAHADSYGKSVVASSIAVVIHSRSSCLPIFPVLRPQPMAESSLWHGRQNAKDLPAATLFHLTLWFPVCETRVSEEIAICVARSVLVAKLCSLGDRFRTSNLDDLVALR